MAGPTLGSFLQPQVIVDVVSRIRAGQGRIGKWLGFHYGLDAPERGNLIGPAGKETPTRSGTYRIFDRTRTVALGRAPGVGPAIVAPKEIGEVSFTCARFYEGIPLDAEQLQNLSPIMGPQSTIDQGGQSYIAEQLKFQATRFNNALECMAAGVIRGTMYLKNSGDDWIPVLSAPASPAPYVTIDFKMPAGNKGQLDMLGAGAIIDVTWANPAAKIISLHLPKIADAFVALTGYVVTDVWVSPTLWGSIILNTEVINSGGSANTPFSEFEYVRERNADGGQTAEVVAVLRGYPTLRWHIISDRLVIDGTDSGGTLTTVLPANTALFMPEVDTEWIDLFHYGEHIAAAPGLPMVKRPSYHIWSETITRPSSILLQGLLNAIPRLRIPKALALGTVVF